MRLAGLLACAPLARPWHLAGPGDLARRRAQIPVAVFKDLFWVLAGPVDATPAHLAAACRTA